MMKPLRPFHWLRKRRSGWGSDERSALRSDEDRIALAAYRLAVGPREPHPCLDVRVLRTGQGVPEPSPGARDTGTATLTTTDPP
jgi:hypothetical protein